MADEKVELTFSNKAAVILMSLGREQAAEVIKHLSETEVKKLSRAFIAVQELDRNVQRDISMEFNKMLHATEKILIDGRDFAKEVINSAFGEKADESLVEALSGGRKESLASLISDMPTNIADNFLQSEHPQTIAFLLSKMPPEKAANMLSKMSEEMQTEVLIRISKLVQVKRDVVEEVCEVLRNQLRGVSIGGEEILGGPKACAQILNFTNEDVEERILTEVGESNPELADEIRNLMFTFEDITKIEDRSIQNILKEVQREQLAVALKTASAELKELLFKNMSLRAAELLKDDLDSLGPTKLKDVENAQQDIVDIVRRLEAEGKIQLAGADGEDVFV